MTTQQDRPRFSLFANSNRHTISPAAFISGAVSAFAFNVILSLYTDSCSYARHLELVILISYLATYGFPKISHSEQTEIDATGNSCPVPSTLS